MDDSISRQEAVDYFNSIIDGNEEEKEYNKGFIDGLQFATAHLLTMPTAQPEYEPWSAIEAAEAMSYWLKRGFWWNTITELENAGFVICRKKMT